MWLPKGKCRGWLGNPAPVNIGQDLSDTRDARQPDGGWCWRGTQDLEGLLRLTLCYRQEDDLEWLRGCKVAKVCAHDLVNEERIRSE